MNYQCFWCNTALCAEIKPPFLLRAVLRAALNKNGVPHALEKPCISNDSRDTKRSVHAGHALKRSLVGGLALVSGILLWDGVAIAHPLPHSSARTPAQTLAQPLTEAPPQLLAQNQSDVTGTNPGDIPFPLTGEDDGDSSSTEEVRQTAEQLSQDLEEAYAECIASQAAIADVPRRFSLGAPSDTPCISAECAALDAVLLDVRLFLSNLTELEREALQRDPSLRLW